MSFILNSEISKSLLQATELYKVVILLSPKLVSGCFKLKSMTVYTLKHIHFLFSARLYSFRWHRITVQLRTKYVDNCSKSYVKRFTPPSLQKVIKQWKPHVGPCRLCRANISQVGFVYPLYAKSTFSSRFSRNI